MIDLHCHILPIDDGSHNIEESIELVISAKKIGYNTLCCTSHYQVGKYENEKYEIELRKLRFELKNRGIEIELLKGNELYLTPEDLEMLETGVVRTIGNSRYLLVEAIPGMTYGALKKSLLEIRRMGYFPVLAHVERYPYVGIKELEELQQMGIIIQVNVRAVKHKKEIYRWIKLGLVDILASDVHDKKYRNYDFLDILMEIKKEVGIKTFKRLTERTPRRIIENKKIEENDHEKKVFTNGINGDSIVKRIFERINFRRGTDNS
jgi:protein-tyrosine phosphatase